MEHTSYIITSTMKISINQTLTISLTIMPLIGYSRIFICLNYAAEFNGDDLHLPSQRLYQLS